MIQHANGGPVVRARRLCERIKNGTGQSPTGRNRQAKPTIAFRSFNSGIPQSDRRSIRNISFSAHVRWGERGAPVWLQYPWAPIRDRLRYETGSDTHRVPAPVSMVSGRWRRSPSALAVGRLRAGHRYSRVAACLNASGEIAPCDGSGCLACARRRLRLPTLAARAPRTGLCPGSSGSGLRACVARPRPAPPSRPTDDRRARCFDKAKGIPPVPFASPA